MANHGKSGKTQKQKQAHYAKASRAVRYSRRWDERVKEYRGVMAARESAHGRALRIITYLAARRERVNQKAAQS